MWRAHACALMEHQGTFLLTHPAGSASRGLVEVRKRTKRIVAAFAARLLYKSFWLENRKILFARYVQDLCEWAMLGSNQRPLPCEGSTIVC